MSTEAFELTEPELTAEEAETRTVWDCLDRLEDGGIAERSIPE